jgi:hypothetical protein
MFPPVKSIDSGGVRAGGMEYSRALEPAKVNATISSRAISTAELLEDKIMQQDIGRSQLSLSIALWEKSN